MLYMYVCIYTYTHIFINGDKFHFSSKECQLFYKGDFGLGRHEVKWLNISINKGTSDVWGLHHLGGS